MKAQHPTSRGFTLIELLVSLVIVGFAMAVVSGAMSQVIRLLDISSNESQEFPTRWLQTQGLPDLVAHLVFDAHLDRPFEGSREQITLVSTSKLLNSQGVPRSVSLRLTSLGDGSGTRALTVQSRARGFAVRPGADGAAEPALDLKLAQYPGQVEFRFTDDANVDHDRWPPLTGLVERLPSKVKIKAVGESDRWHAVAIFEGPTTNPRKKGGERFPGFGL